MNKISECAKKQKLMLRREKTGMGRIVRRKHSGSTTCEKYDPEIAQIIRKYKILLKIIIAYII